MSEEMHPSEGMHPLLWAAVVTFIDEGPAGLWRFMKSLSAEESALLERLSGDYMRERGVDPDSIDGAVRMMFAPLFSGDEEPLRPPHQFKGRELGDTVTPLDEEGRPLAEKAWKVDETEEIRFVAGPVGIDIEAVARYNLLHQPEPGPLDYGPRSGRVREGRYIPATMFPATAVNVATGEIATVGVTHIPAEARRYPSQMFSIVFPN